MDEKRKKAQERVANLARLHGVDVKWALDMFRQRVNTVGLIRGEKQIRHRLEHGSQWKVDVLKPWKWVG